MPFFSAIFRIQALGLLLLLLLSAQALAQGESTEVLDERFPDITEPQFRLMERHSFPGELLRSAAWQDPSHFLCLTAGPEGARVWSVDYESGERSMFISPPFFNEHIAGFPDCMNLSWSLSPSLHYMFLHWQDSSGEARWRLLDISDPPFYISKSFDPPGGMRIHDILFSDDDRFAVFSNDAWSEGSEISLLVLDLQNGSEAWRLSTHDLSFLRRIWWAGETGSQVCMASAELRNGEFRETPELAIIDVQQQQLSFDDERRGLLMTDNADWGSVACLMSPERPEAPFYIRADTRDFGTNLQVPLSDEPLDLICLSEPGLILLRNTVNHSVSQLWLINLHSGDKHLVSSDCSYFEVDRQGKLLVVPRGSNELHVLQLFLPQH
ncbi:MAG: hypothetical protein R3F46_10155 [bacterium]